jgi:hypothetical protein
MPAGRAAASALTVPALFLYTRNKTTRVCHHAASDRQREWSTFTPDELSRLTDDEKTALTALLKRTVDADRYPFSPRIGTEDRRRPCDEFS